MNHLNNVELDNVGKVVKRPECANPGCTREGWVLFGRAFICGKCYDNYQKAEHDKKMKQLAEANL